MRKDNLAAIHYLEDYCAPDRIRDFAVMLKGPWGAGKTHFLEQFLSERSNSLPTSIYVSLYGATSAQDISDEIFRQLHPVLASKSMRLMGRVAKGLLRGALKIDLDGDGKTDGSINVTAPDLRIKDEFADPNGKLLIFDDLERCSMKVGDVLGYVNSFVEHQGMKAIVIANEDDIAEQGYETRKEKLIGQTLRIWPNLDEAFDAFLDELHHEQTREFLGLQRTLLLDIYEASETENLRLLKHAMWDFERLVSQLEIERWKNLEAMQSMLQTVCVASFEHRVGRLSDRSQVAKIYNPYATLVKPGDGHEIPIGQAIADRYQSVPFANGTLNASVLESFIFDGQCDPEALAFSLDGSRFFADPKRTPLWLRAWNYYHLTDNEFDEVLKELLESFEARRFLTEGTVFHVIGILLRYADLGLISDSKKDVLSMAKAYLDDFLGTLPMDHELKRYSGYARDDQTTGYAVCESSSPEFRAALSYYDQKYEELARARYEQIAREVLCNIAERSVELVAGSFAHDPKAALYAQRPIFASLEPEVFARLVMTAKPVEQYTLFSALRERHKFVEANSPMMEEKTWMVKAREAVVTVAEDAHSLTRHRLISLASNETE